MQAFFVSPVGKCVCIGVDPLWTGAGRTIGSLPKALVCRHFARPRTADLLQVRRRSKVRLTERRKLAAAWILSVRPQLKGRGVRPRTFAAQLPVPPESATVSSEHLPPVPPSGTSRCADATVQDKAEAGFEIDETLRRRQRRVGSARPRATASARPASRARPRDDLLGDPQSATQVPPSRLKPAEPAVHPCVSGFLRALPLPWKR